MLQVKYLKHLQSEEYCDCPPPGPGGGGGAGGGGPPQLSASIRLLDIVAIGSDTLLSEIVTSVWCVVSLNGSVVHNYYDLVYQI